MANQTASPHEAKVAKQKLLDLDKKPPKNVRDIDKTKINWHYTYNVSLSGEITLGKEGIFVFNFRENRWEEK